MSEYAERNARKQGEHYTKHVLAMTDEGLHSKAGIAAELAHRDIQISQLQTEIEGLRGERDKYKACIKEIKKEVSDDTALGYHNYILLLINKITGV